MDCISHSDVYKMCQVNLHAGNKNCNQGCNQSDFSYSILMNRKWVNNLMNDTRMKWRDPSMIPTFHECSFWKDMRNAMGTMWANCEYLSSFLIYKTNYFWYICSIKGMLWIEYTLSPLWIFSNVSMGVKKSHKKQSDWNEAHVSLETADNSSQHQVELTQWYHF